MDSTGDLDPDRIGDDPIADELINRLGASLRDGTVLDLQDGSIPADLIRDVLLGKSCGGRNESVIRLADVDPRGLLITNAVIQGHVDLDDAEIKSAISITQSSIPLGISMKGARLRRGLDLTGCIIEILDLKGAHIEGELNLRGAQLTGANQDGNSLVGDRLRVAGGAFLDGGFTAAGAVRLSGANITGLLNLRVAQLTGADQDGDSLVGDRLRVDGGAFLDGGFTAAGAVRLSGANITGLLNLRGAQLTGADQDGDSLVGDGLQVDGDAFLDGGFTAAGAVRLPGANITGQLNLRDAQLTGANQDGNSLVGDRLQVAGDAFLDGGFTAAGAVRLSGANITGQLNLEGAQLTGANQDGNSLVGDRLQVAGDAFLDGGFTAAGAVRLSGANITGQLNLGGAQLTGANQDGDSLVGDRLRVDGGAFLDRGFTAAGAVRLPGANITGQLNLGGAQLTGADQDGDSLVGDSLQVVGGAFLDRGFTAAGAVRLPGANITGQLNLGGAQLTGANQDGDSLVGDRLQVAGGAFLNGGFTAAGAVRLSGANITGQLNLGGAQLTGANQDGDSLVGDSLQVAGGAFLNRGFTAAGAVRLPGANITGQLNLGGAQLTGADQDGDSLVGDRLQVAGGAFLDRGFTAAGAVRLPGANITGQLNLEGAQLTGANQDGDSLVGDRLQVAGGAFLDGGFTAAGAVRLLGANITGQLNLEGAQLTGANQDGNSLVGDDLQVAGGAFLNGGFTAEATVSLTGARLGRILAVQASGIPAGPISSPKLDLAGASVDELSLDLRDVQWVDRRKVRPDKRPNEVLAAQRVVSLENCSYQQRPDPRFGSLETWLRVLRFHTPDYQPRSYQQLAAVHRAAGHDRDASRILMAQQDHRRATTLRPKPNATAVHRAGLSASRAGLAIWKATLGYGYRPRRALAWLLALLTTAGLLVTVAGHWPTDPATPDVPVAYRPANPDTGTPLSYCSAGEATGLAVRIAIPLVTNIGQGACLINTASIPGSWIVTISIALQAFAWILGGLTIAAATTAIKRSP